MENIQRQAKICPFMSTPDKNRACGPECILFRSVSKAGFECMFAAIQSISWNLGHPPKNGSNEPKY